MSTTPTPRTDASYRVAVESSHDSLETLKDMVDFARQLERELTAANERAEKWEKVARELYVASTTYGPSTRAAIDEALAAYYAAKEGK